MKRLLLSFLFVTFLCYAGYSQSEEKLFYFGAGIGFGFYNPQDLNAVIKSNYGDNYMLESGTFDMLLYFVLNAKGSFFFSRYTELQVEIEGAIGPKVVSTENYGNSDFYSFNRFTPALKFNFHIPAGKRLSVYLGPGINWSTMKFSNTEGADLKGSCIGYSGQAGVMLKFSKWAIQPFVTVNVINDKNEDTGGITYTVSNPDLNYTGVQIGNTFFF
jgi:hypothetical protein